MKLNLFALMRKGPDGAGVIFDPQNNKAMTLNEVGVVIWEALEKDLAEAEILDAVTAEFDVAREEAAKDVADFLENLKKRGLLTD